MYRKILSFILILCLCMGMVGNINVCAAELQEDAEGTIIAMSSSEADEQLVSEESEIEIPQNGSEVYMEGVEMQPALFSLRAVGETSGKRYTVLVLDDSAPVTFNDTQGSVMYRADTALPHVQGASKKFLMSTIRILRPCHSAWSCPRGGAGRNQTIQRR